MKTLKFKIYTLGCKVNQYDSLTLAKEFLTHGFKKVNANANLVVINTCSVTKIAIAKDRSMINRARKENPSAKIIVMGCWPKVYIPKIPGVDLVWSNRDYPKLLKKIRDLFSLDFVNNVSCSDFKALSTDKARYFIKIQDGCRQFCSYCVIAHARGELLSRDPKEVIAEIKGALESGFEEIVLSGIHLGLYGVDFPSPQPSPSQERGLVGILKKIIALPGNFRLRLSSIEVTEVTDELIKLMASTKKICQHLHISLQSGSDKILKSMNRPYTTKEFLARVSKLRKAMPDISLTTDIIVGFPGETESDFKDTYNFSQKINFSKIHVFSFSAHEKAPAFYFPDQIKPEIIKNRSVRLRELSVTLEKTYQKQILKKYRNKKLVILIEKIAADKIKGKTEYYFDIILDFQQINLPKNHKLNIVKTRADVL